MIKIFLDGATFIKVFSTSFTSLAGLTTGAFYYAASKQNKVDEQTSLAISRQKEALEIQNEHLGKLRRITYQ
ncbi:hypothetical protein [Mycoplasma parvum]|uniref:Uncharacterized protein n=1 Tax=Mycoplasma parvum str. Indiana TaxID=1403316 RepID=U5NBC2_9MOLU|nr:hypothetical protein [Mycoplasma parvum]AGX88836.1 hypothetical protein PRV_00300 [Mycoplasma parvum str. Indiana]